MPALLQLSRLVGDMLQLSPLSPRGKENAWRTRHFTCAHHEWPTIVIQASPRMVYNNNNSNNTNTDTHNNSNGDTTITSPAIPPLPPPTTKRPGERQAGRKLSLEHRLSPVSKTTKNTHQQQSTCLPAGYT